VRRNGWRIREVPKLLHRALLVTFWATIPHRLIAIS
jgi:hypothetical protein